MFKNYFIVRKLTVYIETTYVCMIVKARNIYLPYTIGGNKCLQKFLGHSFYKCILTIIGSNVSIFHLILTIRVIYYKINAR